MNFEDAPPGLGLYADRDAGEFARDGKFIARARNGKKLALRCPLGNGHIGREPRNRETLWQQSEFEVAGGDVHCELKETPDEATIHSDGSAINVGSAPIFRLGVLK